MQPPDTLDLQITENRCYALNREDDMKDRPLHYAALAGHAAAAKVRGSDSFGKTR